MPQQDQVPPESSDSAEVGSDAAVEALGDTNDMTEFLFSQLPPHPPGEPVRPLRLTPAARVSPLFLRYRREQKKREPPGASPYYCDRCKP